MHRRRFLASLPLLPGLAGCTQRPDASISAPPTTGSETATETDAAAEAVRIDELCIADFIEYPLSGTHPHVHRRATTQYVVVRVESSFSDETARNRLTLELDGEPVSLAERQPVGWQYDTVDLAFAVSKDATVTGGRVLFDGTVIQSLSDATVDRLNNPPIFEVSTPSVSPEELDTTEVTEVTVRFTLANTGSGAGTFGASLATNYHSGYQTVTATLDPGEEKAVTASGRVRPTDAGATVGLNRGSGEWLTTVPVADGELMSETPTPVESPD